MGAHKRPLTFRFSEETVSQIDQIKEAFAPFTEDRASALRTIVQIVWAMLFSPGTLHELAYIVQRLHANTSAYADSQLSFRFPPQPGQAIRPRFAPGIRKESAA